MPSRNGWIAGLFAALLTSFPAVAPAQLGSGWTAYEGRERVQTRGCATYATEAGVQRFALTCGDNSGDNRAEQRVENDYSSGSNQFEGEVRVVSLGGSNVSLKQTFMPNNGAFLMIAVAGDGRLYSVGDGAPGELATGIIGRWVRINTIHDVSAGTHEIHVDGALRFTKRGARQVAWHDKYGTYRLGSGRGPIVAEWRNVKYWRGGRGTGGMPQPPPPAGDAGPADAAPEDAADAGDVSAPAGTGGAGPPATGGSGPVATGGSGGPTGAGGAGTGGATGSGGTASGTGGGRGGSGGGSAVPPANDPPDPPGCGCALGSGGRRGGALALTVLLLLAVRSSARRRRGT